MARCTRLLIWPWMLFALAFMSLPHIGCGAQLEDAEDVEEELHENIGGAGAAHGDHGEEGDEAHANTNPLSIDPDLAIFTAIVFLLLLAVLSKFAWRPIADGLSKREQAVAQQIEEARLNNERAAELLRQHEGRLAAAADEVRQMLNEARRDAETTKERILTEAQAQAQRQTQKALEDIQLAKEGALREIAGRSVDVAVDLARNIVRQEITPARHQQLIQDALEKFPRQS